MKKKIIISLAICVFIAVLVWGGALTKNRILTEIHKDKIENMQFVAYEEPLPEFDWYRIISYSDEKMEIYYVNTAGGDTDTQYKIGGKIICRQTANGWTHTDMIESILWSGAGSADDDVWPYWYHIFLV